MADATLSRSMAHRSGNQSADESDDDNGNGVVSVGVNDGMTENDCEKVKVVHEMQKPQTKTELRRMLGFF